MTNESETNACVGSKWSTQEINILYKLKTAGKTYEEISEVLTKVEGRRTYTANCCKMKWRDTDWSVIIKQIEKTQADEDDNELLKADKDRVVEATLDNHRRFLKREQTRTDIIIDAVKSSIYRLPKPKSDRITYLPPKTSDYSSEHVGLVLSDLHIGACYSKEDTGGLSEFNLEIFKHRMETYKKSVLKIVERHSLMYELPELHVFCLGDIVAGMAEAGSWSMSYIDLDIYDQMIEGVAAIRDFMAVVSQRFKKVRFYGVYGNHGRIGKRGVQKVSTNWDRLCYEFLKVSLTDYENIEWNIPKTWFIQTDIQGHNFFLTHGDGISGSMGIPHYGVERAERNIAGMMETRPNYFIIGHFHSAAEMQSNSSKIIMNGSFMGGDMYSLRDLRKCDRAEQKIFGIHKEHGVTWTYNIRLDSDV